MRLPPRFSVPSLSLIVPAFDQPVDVIESVPPLRLNMPPAALLKLVALMVTLSPLLTLIVPWLVKLMSLMVKLPPLYPALIVPSLTMPLPVRSS